MRGVCTQKRGRGMGSVMKTSVGVDLQLAYGNLIAEPAAPGLLGLALLGVRRKRN